MLWRDLFGLVLGLCREKKFHTVEIIECGGVFVFVVYSLVFGIDFYPSMRELVERPMHLFCVELYLNKGW